MNTFKSRAGRFRRWSSFSSRTRKHRLAVHGQRMPSKLVKKLTDSIFELRVKHFDRIYRVLWFYVKGRLIVVTSAFQKKGQKTPKAEIKRAERLREQWLKQR